MLILVVAGKLIDVIHKKSARYFFDHLRDVEKYAKRQVCGAEKVSLAIQTAAEGLVSGEFCNARRRIAHLVTMYGFLIYVITTVILVFAYPTPATPTPGILTALWFIGALMVRSEEHTSELQSLMRISYAVFCLKKKKNINELSQS